MKSFAILALTVTLAAGAALAAPAAKKTPTASTQVFTGEIWDQTCARRGSHKAMAEEAGISRGPHMARECTLECHKMGSPLVLYDPATRRIYKLDDQKKAVAFAGEKVKITGTLDAKKDTIHIERIASGKHGG
jgi:hypothetical protein